MAASANPSGNQHESNGNSGHAPDNSGTASAMKHNSGISTDWTPDEQKTLEDGLSKYAAETPVIRYAKIAMTLPNKTVRDVALRCRWMSKKETNKRRKEENTRKSKDKKEKVSDPSSKSSHLPSRPSSHPYSVPAVSLDDDDGISYKVIGGPTGELLEQNAQIFIQISTNFSSYQVQDNISLLCQVRDNILKIMNRYMQNVLSHSIHHVNYYISQFSMNDTPEIMKQMPPLPVKFNEELANTILPRTSNPMQ